ncbi:sensor histidine kinase [Nakamurella sp. GG22]
MQAGSSWSLARRILALQAVVLVIVLGAALAALLVDTDAETERTTGDRVVAVASAVAAAPDVRAALIATYPAGQEVSGPTAALQRYAEDVRSSTGADFVVVMNPDGIRFTHPDPTQIGQEYRGSRDAALAGSTAVETYTGTLGPSVRAIAPVLGPDGRVVGMVAVGVLVDHVDEATNRRLWVLGFIAAGALAIGVIGSLLIASWVRKQTLGKGPQELARLFTYYDAVLASVHEGMVLLDRDGRIVSVNAAGRRLLGLTDDAIGGTAAQAGLPSQVAELIDDLGDLTDELALSDDRVLLISRRQVQVQGAVVGAVVTLRDHTELESLTGELDRVEGFSDALRAQAHESANRLHTVISLIELGETDHALTFAVAELESAQGLADRVMAGVENPAVAALLLAKSAQGAERGIEVAIRPGSFLPPGVAPDAELVTIIGNLVDNAFDVLAGTPDSPSGPRRVEVSSEVVSSEVVSAGEMSANGTVGGTDSEGAAATDPADDASVDAADEVLITVADNGPGLTAEQAASVFVRGWSTKVARGPAGDRGLGLALVAQAVHRCGGRVDVEPGPGARFKVWLPLRRPAETSRDDDRSAVGSGHGVR